jgi:hypothetical protein
VPRILQKNYGCSGLLINSEQTIITTKW